MSSKVHDAYVTAAERGFWTRVLVHCEITCGDEKFCVSVLRPLFDHAFIVIL